MVCDAFFSIKKARIGKSSQCRLGLVNDTVGNLEVGCCGRALSHHCQGAKKW